MTQPDGTFRAVSAGRSETPISQTEQQLNNSLRGMNSWLSGSLWAGFAL
jgi:hypothetical protein